MNSNITIKYQKGAALIVIASLLVLTIVTLVMKEYRGNKTIQSRTDQSIKVLQQAREGIIAFSMNNPVGIGRLPHPDRNTDAPPQFDGISDCVTTTPLNAALLIGRLPNVATAGCNGPNIDPVSIDVSESAYPLHYAVSGTMVAVNGLAIAPNLANNPPIPGAQWLSLFDQNGNLVSNRIAFIVFDPGPAVAGQVRTNLAGNNQFLDSLNVPGQGLIDNAVVTDFRFVMAPKSSSFNDRLVYVTIDQLLINIRQRIVADFNAMFLDFFANNSNPNPYYPYPGDVNGVCNDTLVTGQPSINNNNSLPGCFSAFLTQALTPLQTNWLSVLNYTVSPTCNRADNTDCITNIPYTLN